MRLMRFDIPDMPGATLVSPVAMRPIFCAVVVAMALLPVRAAAQDPATGTPPVPVDTAVRPVGPVRAGDVLQLKMLNEEGVSGDYIIDPEGVVTIPGIGVVRLANRQPREARALLEREIRTRFSNPEFSADFRLRVYILGAGVANPGPFIVEPGTTFLQVLAIAGGQSDRADLERTTVIRENRTYPVNLAAGLAGGHVGQLPVFSNDYIVVPAKRGLTRENVGFALSIVGTALTVVTLVVSLQRD